MTERIRVDTDPTKHKHVDALAIASFKLACGCAIPPSVPRDASEAFILKHVGCTYPCRKHGEQIITRATTRLVGWRDAPPPGWRPDD